MALQLEPNKTYQVKVLSIDRMNRRPSFNTQHGIRYNYVITVEVKIKGEVKTGDIEFASQSPEIDGIPFYIGKSRWVKCKQCGDYGCEVTEWDPEDPNANHDDKVELARKLADPNYKPPVRQAAPNNAGFNPSYLTMCISYCKDLKVAEIRSRGENYVVDEKEIVERVFNMGVDLYERVNGYLSKQQNTI
jgi:hypothetical protein